MSQSTEASDMKFIARGGKVIFTGEGVEVEYLAISPELKEKQHGAAQELATMFNDQLQKGLLRI